MSDARPPCSAVSLRVLRDIQAAGSAVVARSATRGRTWFALMGAGDFINCTPDTVARLLAFGYLLTDGYGRLTVSSEGLMAIQNKGETNDRR